MEILLQGGELQSIVMDFLHLEERRKKEIGELRFTVFVEGMKWIEGDRYSKTEFDEYDEDAHHVGIFRKEADDFIAYARILRKNQPRGIMLEGEVFKVLLAEGFKIPPSSIEVSRFCVNPAFRNKPQGAKAQMLLFKSMLAYMKRHHYKYLFAIADEKDARGYSHASFLLKRFSFKRVGVGHYFRPRIKTLALLLEVSDLERDVQNLR